MNKLELHKQAQRSSNFFLDQRLGTESWQMIERNRKRGIKAMIQQLHESQAEAMWLRSSR